MRILQKTRSKDIHFWKNGEQFFAINRYNAQNPSTKLGTINRGPRGWQVICQLDLCYSILKNQDDAYIMNTADHVIYNSPFC